MDDGTIMQYLKLAVGLIFTVGLILIGVALFNRVSSTASIIKEQQEKELSAIEESNITKYDGQLIKGAEAVNYIKQNYDDVQIFVTNSAGTTFVAAESQFSDYKKITSTYYISPVDSFEVNVTRSASGHINKVTIVYTP